MKVVLIILLALTLLVLLVLIYLLVYPASIWIDSKKQRAGVGWNRWLKATIVRSGENDISVYFLGWKKNYNIQSLAFSLGKKAKKRRQHKRVRKKPRKGMKRLKFTRLLKACTIQEFNLKLDTGDCIQNAYLFPIFQGIKWKTGYDTQINFNGFNEIKLVLKVKLLRILL